MYDYQKEHHIEIDRYGDVLHIDLMYPNVNLEGVQEIHFDQCSVRASGGLRISFDYHRDGYVIKQCVEFDVPTKWVEVGFYSSFHPDGDHSL